ncbi:MAG TPA: SCO family protein, partial [Acidimicrobiales bacterium]|nr:SCO family protein [Acidimicrobiales bacterium]
MRGRRSVGMLVLAAVAAGVGLAACSSPPGPPAGSVGTVVDRPVPPAIRQVPLTDQRDRTVDLASWAGKTVLLVPFLTLCADICPMTTGNLLQVERALRSDGAAGDVVVV